MKAILIASIFKFHSQAGSRSESITSDSASFSARGSSSETEVEVIFHITRRFSFRRQKKAAGGKAWGEVIFQHLISFIFIV